MRLATLTLLLGMVVGFAARSLIADHPNWYLVFASAKQPPQRVVQAPPPGSAMPVSHASPEWTLSFLRKRFDEAVVVVLADETWGEGKKFVHETVLEVWKGPAGLVGKSMDWNPEPMIPMSNLHGTVTRRVIRFMPLTPFLDASSSIGCSGNVLVMCPALTIEAVKDALVGGAGSSEPNSSAGAKST